MSLSSQVKVRLAILASGSGSNAECIMRHFHKHPTVEVVWVGSNRKSAGVLDRAAAWDVPASAFNREACDDGTLLGELNSRKVDWVALAGFLLQIPADVVGAFPDRIVNIHPALLPDFGGKGMYGMHVHRAVRASELLRSGMTIHWVNAEYDDGAVIFQAEVELEAHDDAEKIAERVLELEHQYYAPVLEGLMIGWSERLADGAIKPNR